MTMRYEWVMGIEEGTRWDEHWVLYGNQFDNKLHKKLKKKKNSVGEDAKLCSDEVDKY